MILKMILVDNQAVIWTFHIRVINPEFALASWFKIIQTKVQDRHDGHFKLIHA